MIGKKDETYLENRQANRQHTGVKGLLIVVAHQLSFIDPALGTILQVVLSVVVAIRFMSLLSPRHPGLQVLEFQILGKLVELLPSLVEDRVSVASTIAGLLRDVEDTDCRLCDEVDNVQETPGEAGFTCERGDEILELAHHNVVVAGVIAGDAENLVRALVEFSHVRTTKTKTNLVIYAKLLQKARELDCEIQACMRPRKLDDVQEEGEWLAVLLEMYGERGIGVMIRR